MAIIEGVEYSIAALHQMSGLPVGTIRDRIKLHPNETLSYILRPSREYRGTIATKSGKRIENVRAARMIGVAYQNFMLWKKSHPYNVYEDAVKYFGEFQADETKMWAMVEELDPVWLGSWSRGMESDEEHYTRLCQLCGIDERYADEFKERYPNA